jgi:hypothetical protein
VGIDYINKQLFMMTDEERTAFLASLIPFTYDHQHYQLDPIKNYVLDPDDDIVGVWHMDKIYWTCEGWRMHQRLGGNEHTVAACLASARGGGNNSISDRLDMLEQQIASGEINEGTYIEKCKSLMDEYRGGSHLSERCRTVNEWGQYRWEIIQ